jgi:hypothetical protein
MNIHIDFYEEQTVPHTALLHLPDIPNVLY